MVEHLSREDIYPLAGAFQETHSLSYHTFPTHKVSVPHPTTVASKPSPQHLTSLVYVRDPQGERFLSAAGPFDQGHFLTLDRARGEQHYYPPIPRHPSPQGIPRRPYKSIAYRKDRRMAKKRRSLQAILIPSFLQSPLTSPTSPSAPIPARPDLNTGSNYFIPPVDTPSTPSTSNVTSPRSSSPPSFLLDDDPFANLSSPFETIQRIGPPQTTSHSRSPDTTPIKPRSPLKPTPEHGAPPSSPPSKPPVRSRVASKSISFGRMQPIPAYQKPAFAPKPSLPSLDTLSRTNVVLMKRVRKGRVGATLPFEPWDNLDSLASPINSSPSTSSSVVSAPLPMPTSPAPSPLSETQAGPPVVPKDVVGAEQATVSAAFTSTSASRTAEVDANPDGSASLSDHSPDVIAINSIQSSTQSSSRNDGHSELPYTTDTDADADADADAFDSPFLPPLSPPASHDYSFASLSRSASTSSSGSDDYNFGATTSRYGNDDLASGISAESEADFLNLPLEYYFSSPSGYSTTAITSWQSDANCESENTPSSSVYSDITDEPEVMYQPGSSTGTMRPVVFPQARYFGDRSVHEGELVDGADYDNYHGASNSSFSYAGAFRSYGNAERSGARRPSGGLGGGHGNDDDDRGNRRPSRPSVFSATSSSEVTSDEGEESNDELEAGKAKRSGARASTSDDDVPLAQSIPTALVAQKSIRKQVREERDQRRRERSEQAARSRQATLRPAGTSKAAPGGALSSSQEAALQATRITTRPRTQTLPGHATSPFSAEDLMRKLQDVQVAPARNPRVTSNSASRTSGDVDVQGAFGKAERETPTVSQVARPLRPARSFHRLQGRVIDDQKSVPQPTSPDPKIARARSRSHAREDKTGFEVVSRAPVPRMSEDQKRMVKPHGESRSARPSLDGERRPRPSTSDRPPVPPLPPIETPAKTTMHQRVFIGDMQRYNVVEVEDTTSAGDVIGMLEAQGSLKGWIGTGEWMVWEIAHDFGMERPIRNFERLSDVQASWNKDKMLNTFVARLTSLAPLLSRTAIPSSSPTYAGYVEWESKRGKWSKRWLQLREHCLWISKRDNGRDEVLLCSLSNFDAYHINRLYKAPKPFVFSVKSTDNLSFFENASDYLHVFSCSEKEGKNWMEKILVARSYVLHQERNILFNPKSYGGQPTVGTSSVLSRSSTNRRPAQPLVSVANHDVFEPGSLLHRKG